MKRILKWLKKSFSRHSPATEADGQRTPVIVEPDDLANDEYIVDRIEGQGPVENVVMPEIYADGHVAIEPEFKELDLRSPGVDRSTGYNPYDTAVLQNKDGV